jgi:hypothetical protein
MNSERILASLASKMKKDVGHRVDITLADTKKINKTTAQFLLEYAGNIPTSEEISDYFIRAFNAKITPFMTTAKVFEDQKAVMVVAQILNITRDVDDIKTRKMVPVIAGAVYLDVPLDETWEVSERNGKKVLCRKVKDDIMAIISARRNAMMDPTSKISFASLSLGSTLNKYIGLVGTGDVVKAFIDDKVKEVEVTAADKEKIEVKDADGKKVRVNREQIVEIMKKATDRGADQAKYLEDYYTKAYGDPEFAKKLVSPK